MIDDPHDNGGLPGTWAKWLDETCRDIRTLSDKELHSPFILDHLMRWHGLKTTREALDMKGAEVMRRTQSNDYGSNFKRARHG
jgi:hypothetical protein